MIAREPVGVGLGKRVSVVIFGREGAILSDPSTQALIAASSILVTGSMLLSPLIADLAVVFAVSEARAGWLIVAFTLGAALSLPFAGLVADRVGRRLLIVSGLLVFGLAGGAISVVSWFELALILRVCQGIGYAAVSPIILTIFGDLYRDSQETTVQGMRVTANSVVNAFIPLLAGVLIAYSWRYPFVIYLAAVPLAGWIWIALPRIEPAANESVVRYLENVVSFIGELTISMLMISFFFRFVVFYGMITYISVLALREAGLAAVAVGALLSVRSAVKMFASTQAGRLALSYRPAYLSVIGFAGISLATVLMGLLPTSAYLLFGMVAFGVGDGILSPCQKSLVNRLASAEFRGGAMSIAITLQNAGKVIGPAALALTLVYVGPAPAFVLLGTIGGGLGTGALLVTAVRSDG